MTYRVEYTARARRDLHKFDRETAQRIIRALHGLADDPYSRIKKLKGTNPDQPVYSFRIGLSYRAILSIHDSVLIVHILEIERRDQAYRDF
jgi:mRNA interferase RelE/StbE